MSLPLSTDVHSRLVNFIRYLETQSFIEPSNDRIVNTLKNLLHDITGVWYSNNDLSLRTVETLLKGALWVVDHLPTASPCPPCPSCPPLPSGDYATLDGTVSQNYFDSNNQPVTNILLDSATGVGSGEILILGSPNLLTFSAAVFTGEAANGVTITTCPALTSVSIPQLDVSLAGSVVPVDLSANPVLTDIDISSATWGAGAQLNASGCALTEDCVNEILVRAETFLPGFNSGSIDLSGGTSAAPTGAGATAKTNLIAAGVTVTTN